MNWFTRHFQKNESNGITQAQLERLTASLLDAARIAAVETIRKQVGVLKKVAEETNRENSDLRKTVVELSAVVKTLKKTVDTIGEGYEAALQKMERLHVGVSEDRKGMTEALNVMNGRLNDVIPFNRAKDATSLLANLGKANDQPSKSTTVAPR